MGDAERTSSFFDRYSKKYDIKYINKYFKDNYRWLFAHIPDLTGKCIADIGCGTGELCNAISSLYDTVEVYGVDISKKMIAKAKTINSNNKNVFLSVGDAHNLHFKSNSFDYVINTISFHHYQQPNLALSEFYRILKPGGTLILLDSVTNPFIISFMPTFWDIKERAKCYTRHLSTRKFRQLFDASDFKKVDYCYYMRFFPARHILCKAVK